VASGDVWQEEKIKTAGLETSVPLEEELQFGSFLVYH
jgi:hypothetical protein